MVLHQLLPRSSQICWKSVPRLPSARGLRFCQNSSPPSAPQLSCRSSRRRNTHTLAAAPDTATEPAQESASPEPAGIDISSLDMRVGRILQVDDHPEADKLYVESIDVGEDEPRTIASGLKDFVDKDSLKDRLVIVLCNLKPRKMRGVASNGMLLCASNEAHDQVETLSPPAGAQPGERVFFGDGNAQQPEPMSPNQVQKKKAFEALQPDLHTSTTRLAMWKDKLMLTRHGPVAAPTLSHARIS